MKMDYSEIIRYLIIGGLTTIFSLLIYYILTSTILNANVLIELQLANIIQWISSVTIAYFTNKYYVFKDNSKNKIDIIKFFLSRAATLLIDMLLMYIFVTKFFFNHRIVKVIVQIIVIIGNYALSKFYVFKINNK